MTNEETLKALFKKAFAKEPEGLARLPGSGSNRQYYRLSGGGKTVIGAAGTNPAENAAFFAIARSLREAGANVPEVYAGDGLCYIQEDLGDTVLFDAACRDHKYTPEQRRLLEKAVRALPLIQFGGGRRLDWSVCYPQPSFDADNIRFDLNYFKFCFLKLSGVEFDEIALQRDFDALEADLLAADQGLDTFMYRDFQARNVMLRDGEPWFIDFQGGRRGPVHYDLASFVFQARAAYPEDLREALIDAYLEALEPYRRVDHAAFRRTLRLFVLFRNLQTLGAYGLRGLHERKPHFLESIPHAVANLGTALPRGRYPALEAVARSLKDIFEDAPHPGADTLPDDGNVLTVTITSFSFRKGIPEDRSGNGGGYVFDCRGVHNPGKYQEFKQLTGLDGPVVKFLEDDREITELLSHAYSLVDAHVERFLERGFTHLSVSFGCTGGQHRSAYSAEHLAEHLAELYPVRIELVHRELGIRRVLSNLEFEHAK